MIIDLHCHSKYSYDCYLEPADLIQRARALGLDGVCIAEHHSYTAYHYISHLEQSDDFFILRGLEISTTMGHLLAYGVKDDTWNTWSGNTYRDINQVISNVHLV